MPQFPEKRNINIPCSRDASSQSLLDEEPVMRTAIACGFKHFSFDKEDRQHQFRWPLSIGETTLGSFPKFILEREDFQLLSGAAMESWLVNLVSVPTSDFRKAKRPITESTNQE